MFEQEGEVGGVCVRERDREREREDECECVCKKERVLCTLDVASCFKQLPTSAGSARRLLNKQHIHRPLQDKRLGCRV